MPDDWLPWLEIVDDLVNHDLVRVTGTACPADETTETPMPFPPNLPDIESPSEAIACCCSLHDVDGQAACSGSFLNRAEVTGGGFGDIWAAGIRQARTPCRCCTPTHARQVLMPSAT